MRHKIIILGLSLFILPALAHAALININTVDATLLDTLPGIGPVIAGHIVDYRVANGPFAAIEDIQKVSGIGSGSTYTKIAPLITVGGTNTSSASDSVPPTQTQTSSGSVTGSMTYVPPPSALSVQVSGNTEALLDVPLQLSARVTTKGGTVDPLARISWSFGDGSSTEGSTVEKTYRYAGTYLVTVMATDGAARAQDDITVIAKPAAVRIATLSGEGITLTNDASERLDLSGWRLLTGTGSFKIPPGTNILPNVSVLFPSTITNLPIALDATLLYPDGIIAAHYTPLIAAVATTTDVLESIGQPSVGSTSYSKVQTVEPITSPRTTVHSHEETGKAPAATTELVAAGAVSTSSTEEAAAAVNARIPGFLRSPWFFGLLGIMTLAGGAFIFL